MRGGADMQAAGRAAMTSASYGASGSFGATWPKKKKKRLPRPKPDAPVTMCWMQSPLLTRIPRPGSARPASASRPPQSLRARSSAMRCPCVHLPSVGDNCTDQMREGSVVAGAC